MKYKITKNLIVLGAVVFSFVFANNALAYSCSGYSCSDSYNPDYGYSNSYSNSYNNRDYYNYRNNNNYNNNYNNNQNRRVYVSDNQNTEPTIINNNYYYPTEQVTKVVTVPQSTTNQVVSPTIPVTEGKPIDIIPTTGSNSSSDINPTSNNTGLVQGNLLGASAYGSGGLTALSLGGSGSFMPSSIWQWIFVVILILIIIIIARMFVKKPSPGDHDAHSAH
jgi:hypothetical protein